MKGDMTAHTRRRFIRNFGTLGFGLGMGTVATLIVYNSDYGLSAEMFSAPRFYVRWAINLAVFLVGGYFFGATMWSSLGKGGDDQ